METIDTSKSVTALREKKKKKEEKKINVCAEQFCRRNALLLMKNRRWIMRSGRVYDSARVPDGGSGKIRARERVSEGARRRSDTTG